MIIPRSSHALIRNLAGITKLVSLKLRLPKSYFLSEPFTLALVSLHILMQLVQEVIVLHNLILLHRDFAIHQIIDGTSDLKVLDLSKYGILYWMTILLKNRAFTLTTPISIQGKVYLMENFDIDVSGYDIIKGCLLKLVVFL